MLNTIIVNRNEAANIGGRVIGQLGSKLVIEVEALPACAYQEANTFLGSVEQRCLPAKIGNRMTIADIQEARSLLEELGDFAKDAKSLNELRLMKQVTDAELALVAVYEEVISNG